MLQLIDFRFGSKCYIIIAKNLEYPGPMGSLLPLGPAKYDACYFNAINNVFGYLTVILVSVDTPHYHAYHLLPFLERNRESIIYSDL